MLAKNSKLLEPLFRRHALLSEACAFKAIILQNADDNTSLLTGRIAIA